MPQSKICRSGAPSHASAIQGKRAQTRIEEDKSAHIALWGVRAYMAVVHNRPRPAVNLRLAHQARQGLAGLGVVGAGGLLACVYPPWLRPLQCCAPACATSPNKPWPNLAAARRRADEAIEGF